MQAPRSPCGGLTELTVGAIGRRELEEFREALLAGRGITALEAEGAWVLPLPYLVPWHWVHAPRGPWGGVTPVGALIVEDFLEALLAGRGTTELEAEGAWVVPLPYLVPWHWVHAPRGPWGGVTPVVGLIVEDLREALLVGRGTTELEAEGAWVLPLPYLVP